MIDLKNIRNFAIISHIDHGKSTLADRFLEITDTVSKREMKEQYLDNMELEREKGITIKMRPVRMVWKSNHSKFPISNNQFSIKSQLSNYPKINSKDDKNEKQFENLKIENSLEIRNWKLEISDSEYILNLIDTPGHIDFSYEVSRALAAIEGVILLVDATQGIQAQTLTNIDIAKSLNLKIIPAVNKIDIKEARVNEAKDDIVKLLQCEKEDIFEISGKTGLGVPELILEVIQKIPPPEIEYKGSEPRALIFDFEYSEHKGIIAFVRVFDGTLQKEDELWLVKAGVKFKVKELGFFNPEFSPKKEINAGEIGYIVTNLKEPSAIKVGDTITSVLNPLPALSGYKEPKPVIWANFFPVSQAEFEMLKKALLKLSLNDSSVSFEEISAPSVGRGFRLGFLGMLHLEIIAERIRREFKIDTINTMPSVSYLVKFKDGTEEKIYSAASFPDDFKILSVKEAWVSAEILSPESKMNDILKVIQEFEGEITSLENFGNERILIKTEMPLRELMRGFFDKLKSASSGYASFNYGTEESDNKWKEANISRLDVLINDEEIFALSRIIPNHRLDREAEDIVEKLKSFLPSALYEIKIQARANGRIISSKKISALKKNVTAHLYGGDRTRKMKLWQKQKKGKTLLKEKSRYQIPPDVFLKIMK